VARHLTRDELDAGLAGIRRSPAERGSLELIVRRPGVNEREVLEEGEFNCELGLVGDTWHRRASPRMPDKSPHPGMQVNLMNARAIALIATDRTRWPLAGDQLYVDLDLSSANLPPGTRLAIGDAVLEVTDVPHTGCAKFGARFGVEAMRFVNSPTGRQLNLRGINARVVVPGRARVGAAVLKMLAD
jgi:MOSC domain-containing protein YiiM